MITTIPTQENPVTQDPKPTGAPAYGTPEPAPATPPAPSHHDVTRLHVDDGVLIQDVLYRVVAIVHHHEGRYTWTEIRLEPQDGTIEAPRFWLTHEVEDGEPELVLWLTQPDPAGLRPGDRSVTYSDVTYTLDDTGESDYTATGEADLDRTGKAEYYDYVGTKDDQKRLSFERFDGEGWELSTGVVISAVSIKVLPS
jgi:hypothetical protein